MSTSIYAKLRKEAKLKVKKEKAIGQDSQAEQFVKKDIVEMPAITEEEVNTLLSALVEDVSATKEIINDLKESSPNPGENKVEQKLFKAIGVYYDSTRKKFMKISIDYNPITLYTGGAVIEDLADSNAVATARISQIFSMKLIRDREII